MKSTELALSIAEKAFQNKFDKGGTPYIEHLTRVMSRVPESWNTAPQLKTIALLHDLLEDCKEWNETVLRTLFSNDIVDSIVKLTMRSDQTYEQYIQEIEKDSWATIIKKFDLEDNMDIRRLKHLQEKDFQRLKKYHEAYKRLTKE